MQLTVQVPVLQLYQTCQIKTGERKRVKIKFQVFFCSPSREANNFYLSFLLKPSRVHFLNNNQSFLLQFDLCTDV
jgi:hypothetical protein